MYKNVIAIQIFKNISYLLIIEQYNNCDSTLQPMKM